VLAAALARKGRAKQSRGRQTLRTRQVRPLCSGWKSKTSGGIVLLCFEGLVVKAYHFDQHTLTAPCPCLPSDKKQF
jgi:hypothetical protein